MQNPESSEQTPVVVDRSNKSFTNGLSPIEETQRVMDAAAPFVRFSDGSTPYAPRTGEVIDTPETGENAPIGYDGLADRLIEQSRDATPLVIADNLKLFLDGIDRDVLNGDVVNSDGEPYTPAKYNSQLATAVGLLNKPVDGKKPLSYIPSVKNLRSAFTTLLGADTKVATAFGDVLTKKVAAIEANEAKEALKAKATAAEGHAALTAAEVPEPAQGSVVESVNPYDAWVNGEVEGSVEAAAVRPVETEDEKQLRERREATEKLNQRDHINNRADDRKAR